MEYTKNVSEKMSERLLFVANMLREESCNIKESEDVPATFRCVADVGCDHGYVSIYLVQSAVADSAIAMDVKKDPLKGAASNIQDFGLSEKISVRLSDGLKELKKGEADGLVIAGMGGPLMLRLLTDNSPKDLGIKMAVLQPQSEIPKFRKFLSENGYLIVNESIILDEGKYYFPMKVAVLDNLSDEERQGFCDRAKALEADVFSLLKEKMGDKTSPEDTDFSIKRICNRYGALNILRKEALLKEYLLHGREVALSILESLDKESHRDRVSQLQEELEDINTVLKLYL